MGHYARNKSNCHFKPGSCQSTHCVLCCSQDQDAQLPSFIRMDTIHWLLCGVRKVTTALHQIGRSKGECSIVSVFVCFLAFCCFALSLVWFEFERFHAAGLQPLILCHRFDPRVRIEDERARSDKLCEQLSCLVHDKRIAEFVWFCSSMDPFSHSKWRAIG